MAHLTTRFPNFIPYTRMYSKTDKKVFQSYTRILYNIADKVSQSQIQHTHTHIFSSTFPR